MTNPDVTDDATDEPFVNRGDEAYTPDEDEVTFHHYDDDGVARGRNTNRWQKYGNDRLYLGGDHEGYIDIQAGEVVDLEPAPQTDIEEFTFSYDDKRDALVLWAVVPEDVARNSLSKKTRKEIARIPCEILVGD